MGYKTWNTGEKVTAANMNAEVRDQVVSQVTSSTRPGSPVEGQMIVETDTDLVQIYTGAAWKRALDFGAFTNWTPSIISSGTQPVLGTGSSTLGRYVQLGNLVIAWFTIQWGSSGVNAGSGIYGFNMPVLANDGSQVVGQLWMTDNSTGFGKHGVLLDTSTTNFQAYCLTGVNDDVTQIGATVPWTWAASDLIAGFVMYEAA